MLTHIPVLTTIGIILLVAGLVLLVAGLVLLVLGRAGKKVADRSHWF